MSGERDKRIQFAQNFLRSPDLVRWLVNRSSIDANDIVYEIGPGRGIITAELAKVAAGVVAVEVDPGLAKELEKRFEDIECVEIVSGDFLNHRIHGSEYKIFSNIPFNATAAIVRKILHAPHPPEDAYLVMQQEAAEKFRGQPRETQFSILAKPNWKMEVVHEFARTDFDPAPSVDACLLRLRRRIRPIIEKKRQAQYRDFVRFGFGRWKKNLKLTYKPVFSYTQWKRLSSDLGIAIDATATDLSFEQWCGLFHCFDELVPRFKQARVYNWD